MRVRRMVLIGLGALLLPAGPASAHGGNGGSSSDYRAEITGYTTRTKGHDEGFELRIVQLGNRLELRRTTARQVMVLGYQGEPYLRVTAHGVFENRSSPAVVLNRTRVPTGAPHH